MVRGTIRVTWNLTVNEVKSRPSAVHDTMTEIKTGLVTLCFVLSHQIRNILRIRSQVFYELRH